MLDDFGETLGWQEMPTGTVTRADVVQIVGVMYDSMVAARCTVAPGSVRHPGRIPDSEAGVSAPGLDDCRGAVSAPGWLRGAQAEMIRDGWSVSRHECGARPEFPVDCMVAVSPDEREIRLFISRFTTDDLADVTPPWLHGRLAAIGPKHVSEWGVGSDARDWRRIRLVPSR